MTKVITKSMTLPGFAQWKFSISCPADFRPIDQDLAPDRNVPDGLRVVEHDGLWISVNARSVEGFDPNFGRTVRKGADGDALNWNTGNRLLTLELHCTNVP
jgi:hypothetical protein